MDPHGSTPGGSHTPSLWSGHSLGSCFLPPGLGPPFLTSFFLPSPLAGSLPLPTHLFFHPSTHLSIHLASLSSMSYVSPEFPGLFPAQSFLTYSNFSLPNPLGHQRAPLPVPLPPVLRESTTWAIPPPSLSPGVFSGTLLWVRDEHSTELFACDPSYLCCVTVTFRRRLGISWDPEATTGASVVVAMGSFLDLVPSTPGAALATRNLGSVTQMAHAEEVTAPPLAQVGPLLAPPPQGRDVGPQFCPSQFLVW